MIEPLQYNKEAYPTYEIARPVFCHGCLSQKTTKNDPNIAVKFCSKCPSTLGQDKEYGAFLCKFCDDRNHKNGVAKAHARQLIVVGPGVRKKVVIRGDGKNFPLPLDHVAVSVKSRIYQNGKCVHKIPWKEMSFVSGMSGRCLHVQVLGARNLKVGDFHGSSDPFVVYSFCGKPLGTTRVRPRSTNPRWDNETFIVPMDENLPTPREMAMSQKDLVRLEVYDHDWVTQNEFLGHVEITRSKLMKIAAISNQLPIRLPLTMKAYHGFINFQFGFDNTHLHIKAVRAENLNSMDARNLSNPYVKIFLGNSFLVGTTATVTRTINPLWATGNVFKIKMLQLLFAERYALSQIDAYHETQERLARINKDTSQQYQSGSASQMMDEFASLPTKLALFRIEIYNDSRWRSHKLLGKAFISVHKLRKMLPTLPAADIVNMTGYTDYVVTTVRQDQFSVKMEALKARKLTWWERISCCPKEKEKMDRPNSPNSRPMSPLQGAGASSKNGLPPTGAMGGAVRRRGNLLGAASAHAPVPAATPHEDLESGLLGRSDAPVDIPSLQNINLPPSRRRKPLEISTAGMGSFSDAAGPLTPATPSALSLSMPNTPGPPALFSPKGGLNGYAPLLGDSQKSARSGSEGSGSPGGSGKGPSVNSNSGGSPRPEVGTPTAETPLLDLPGAAPEETPERPEDMPGQALVPAAAAPTEQESMNAFMQQRFGSSRPAPPPMSEISERSKFSASASVASKASAPVKNTVENDFTSDPLLGQDNTASSVRAPFFNAVNADHSGSSMKMSHRSKSLSRMSQSLSFRAAPEVTWSDSHPFPVMLDLDAHRGVDVLGNPISQGFIVLRLIPATRGSVVLGLDEAVRQMTLGETANVKCRYDYAYGNFSMGSTIPPRANVIFKVKLKEINHRGRYDVLWRMVVRFMRIFWRVFHAFWLYVRGEEDEALLGKSSKKVKKQMSFSAKLMVRLGLSSRKNVYGSDSESDEDLRNDSESEEDEEDGFNGPAYQEGEEGSEDGGSSVDSFQHQSTRPRVKPDPRMRKHLNQSVQSGAQILWNFKPPKVVKKPKAVAKKAEPRTALLQIVEDDHDPGKEGGGAADSDGGDNSDQEEDGGDDRNHHGGSGAYAGQSALGIGFNNQYEAGDNEFNLQRLENGHAHGSDDEEEDY